ncbi:hypothetical protein [Streptomyces sp. ISL-11]|uniref:hypothetical protein n=1 Tax=Streptomyces sp. ISL-11 TaxID=2819174 RepID=UPI001BE8A5C7|nr:hypothetical protein [Streptomyces sp. ISL-11]MBT2385467.1 hypothetical protein [Streptomyces sp. ISL-11]
MSQPFKRAFAVLCAATALGLSGSVTAEAYDHAPKATILDLYMGKQALLNTHQTLRAHLTDDHGNPVSGAYIRMYTPGHSMLCQRATDSHGDATCDAPLAPPAELVNETVNGYNARFDGNDRYLPAEAHAPATLVAGDL